ncbi:Acetyl-CoA synthetase-like protein [Mycena chlorophos]|uniref:Acetyl-CoA synthetase-like protein n=1 Tax=Mycena chlorophos TaxID=658473 RepID=A0A8H6WNC4_MYCCL|nr:Acetyl-CoA synthetase-like protein [Mycena chlorophos]
MAQDLPQLNIGLPVPENILHIARTGDGDKELGYIIDDSRPNEITRISWRRALGDIRQRAQELVGAAQHPARKAGDKELFTVGILGRSSYTFFVTMTAIIMLRWTPLVLSPRNSPSGTLHLLKTAQASHLIADGDLYAFAERLKEEEPSLHLIRSLEVKVHEESGATHESAEVWPDYPKESPEALAAENANGVSIYMHTSGSTGHPKLIPNKHRFQLIQAAALRRQSPEFIRARFYTMMPLFHAAGIIFTYSASIGCLTRLSFLNMRQPPALPSVLRDMALVGQIARDEGQAFLTLLPPSMAEDLVRSEDLEKNLAIFRLPLMMVVGGAPIRPDVGDFLRKEGVRVQSICGMTEVGAIGMMRLADDWRYMELNDMYDYTFRDVDGEAKEMIILPKENSPCVITYHNPEGFATGDLWVQHPTKPNWWRVIGRAGDITVLSNGEKTDNKQLENLLCTSPLIQQAIVFGVSRFLNGVVVTPTNPVTNVDEYLDSIWPHIAANVNTVIPQHSRLIRPLVLVADPKRPFVQTDKRSIARKQTLALYEKDIDAAYIRSEEGGFEEVPVPEGGFASSDVDGITGYVKSVISTILGTTYDIALDKDLFEVGLDSMMAVRVRSAVVAALKAAGREVAVPRNIVYTVPTQAGLAKFLSDTLQSGPQKQAVNIDAAIAETIGRYTKNFQRAGSVYAVTGTTGSLGSFFVALLLSKPEVRKVYLMNRKNDRKTIQERHESGFRDRGLDYEALETAVASGRAVYLDVTVGESHLGLSDAMYEELTAELTHIVHCAWLVNFNLILPSFEAHVAGVRHLLDLALASKHAKPARFTFLSSVGVVGAWKGGLVPETSLDSPASCMDQGYAHSKYVAEKIIEAAVKERPELSATIIRSAQIGGAEGSGAWPRNEYIPSLMRSCKELQVVPGGLQDVRWLPVNVGAEVLYAQVNAAADSGLSIYNFENAVSTPWSLIADALSKLFDAPIIPAEEWLKRVRERTDTSANKLQAFFEGYVHGGVVPALRLEHAREAAGSLLDYEVGSELVEVYAKYAAAS